MMNRLAGMRAYLAGPIDRVADAGVEWRKDMVPFLHSIGVSALDPTNKPIDLHVQDVVVGGVADYGAFKRRLRLLEEEGQFDLVAAEMRKIRCVDLRMVDIADFLVVNIDPEVHLCGTYEELFLANRQKKPIIGRVSGGKIKTPTWLLGTIPHEELFDDWKQVTLYLDMLDKDITSPYSTGRWYFFDQKKLNGIKKGEVK